MFNCSGEGLPLVKSYVLLASNQGSSCLICAGNLGARNVEELIKAQKDKKGKWRKKKCSKKAGKGKCSQKKIAKKCKRSCCEAGY